MHIRISTITSRCSKVLITITDVPIHFGVYLMLSALIESNKVIDFFELLYDLVSPDRTSSWTIGRLQ